MKLEQRDVLSGVQKAINGRRIAPKWSHCLNVAVRMDILVCTVIERDAFDVLICPYEAGVTGWRAAAPTVVAIRRALCPPAAPLEARATQPVALVIHAGQLILS
jgi:hypothetical protein